MKNGNIIINLTANQTGFLGVWLDEPIKGKSNWQGKFMYCNSILYSKMKSFAKEANINFNSEPVVLSI